MKRIVSCLAAVFCCLCISAQTIPADPAFKVGKLPNGMTYYLYHNEIPAGCAEFFIAHNVGALQEEDHQNGLAHFLEHMAFNGTKHYPEKGILDFLAKEGVRFGYNVNAYTSKTETVYNLSKVPLVRDSFVDSVLMVLHDWSCDISCEQQALDDERGVISEEWRLRDDSRNRMANLQTGLIYKGSKQPERTVLGTLEVINGFKREDILDFYHKWYRPDLQALIIVGDFDIKKMEGRIRELFKDIPAPENPEPKGDYTPPALTEPLYSDMTDHEIKYQAFKAIYRQDFAIKDRQDEAFYKDELCRMLITSILSDRMKEQSKEKKSPIQNTTLVTTEYAPDMYVSMATLIPKKKENLAECLRFTEREVKRLVDHGISSQELEAAKLTIADRYHLNSALEKNQAQNDEIVNIALGNFLKDTPLALNPTMRDIRRRQLESITMRDIAPYPNMMFRESGVIYSNCYNHEKDSEIVPTTEQMKAIVAQVAAEEIAPDYIDYPEINLEVKAPAGRILSQSTYKNSDIELWILSNGASVYYKKAEPVKQGDHLSMTMLFDTGYRVFTEEDVTAARFALSHCKRSTGFRGCLKTDFKNYPELAGVRVMLHGGSQAGRIEISSNQEMAENAFKAAHLQITEPYFGEEKLLDAYKATNLKSLGKEKSPTALFNERCREEIYKGHPWTHEIDSAAIEAVSLAALEDIYKRYYGDIPAMEVIICSDLPREQIKSYVERYIASIQCAYPYPKSKYLPIKPQTKGGLDIRETSEPISEPYSQISWSHYFKGCHSIKDRAAAEILDYILSARYLDKIREERGGAYSVSFYTEMSVEKDLPNRSYSEFKTRPEMVNLVVGDLDDELELIRKQGPTEQEMEYAVKYLVKHYYEKEDRISRSINLQEEQVKNYVRWDIPYGYDYEKAVRSVKASDIKAIARKIDAGDRVLIIYTEE